MADLPSADGKGKKVSKPSTALVMNGKTKPAASSSTPRRSPARPQPTPSAAPKTQRVGIRPTLTAPAEQDSDDDEKDDGQDEAPPPPPPKPAPKPPEPKGDEVVRELPF